MYARDAAQGFFYSEVWISFEILTQRAPLETSDDQLCFFDGN